MVVAPFNGSGTFNPELTLQPNTVAKAEDVNTNFTDAATGLSDCITRDGQSPATNNIPMGGHRITGLAAPVATTDAANLATVQSYVPPGAIFPYGGSSAPTGFLLCDGGSYNTSTYPTLYGVLGTSYGGGGGVFNVPDCRGRALVGADNMGTGPANRLSGAGFTQTTLAGTGGAATIIQTEAQLATHNHGGNTGFTSAHHTHSYTSPTNQNVSVQAGSNFSVIGGNFSASTGTDTPDHTHSISSDGSSSAMIVCQPSILLTAIIKT